MSRIIDSMAGRAKVIFSLTLSPTKSKDFDISDYIVENFFVSLVEYVLQNSKAPVMHSDEMANSIYPEWVQIQAKYGLYPQDYKKAAKIITELHTLLIESKI